MMMISLYLITFILLIFSSMIQSLPHCTDPSIRLQPCKLRRCKSYLKYVYEIFFYLLNDICTGIYHQQAINISIAYACIQICHKVFLQSVEITCIV